MIRRILAPALLAAALPAAAQVTPAANYSDIWWNAAESGWGVTFTQHSPSNKVFAVWYTYDPRESDPNSPGNFKPLWLVMPGGDWVTPTQISGDVYVTLGTPFQNGWNASLFGATKVGTFTFSFSSNTAGTFSYAVAAPAGVASSDPAFGMPSFSGTKNIVRQPF